MLFVVVAVNIGTLRRFCPSDVHVLAFGCPHVPGTLDRFATRKSQSTLFDANKHKSLHTYTIFFPDKTNDGVAVDIATARDAAEEDTASAFETS